MSHASGEESLSSNKVSGKQITLPFKRTLRQIGGVTGISIPQDFVKNFNLETGKEYQFYIEVEQ